MFLNQFSVRVVGGKEAAGGYVEMQHGHQYSLCLHNSRGVRADARVEIDGKHVGTWRIPACQSITLERPEHDTGHFTFYRVNSLEAVQAALDPGDPNLGLVKVTFTPERAARPLTVTNWTYYPSYPASPGYPPGVGPLLRDTASTPHWHPVYTQSSGTVSGADSNTYTVNACSYSAGGTGLSDESGQRFGVAEWIDCDTAQQTVIHLRLVEGSAAESPRPLTCYSTPVPPAVR